MHTAAFRAYRTCRVEGCDLEPERSLVVLGIPAYLAGVVMFAFTGWRAASNEEHKFVDIVGAALLLALGVTVLVLA